MNRVERVAPGLFAAGAGALVLTVLIGTDLGGTGWRLAVGAAGAMACAIGRLRHRLPFVFIAVNVLAGLRVVTKPIDDSMSPVERLDLSNGIVDLVIGIGLIVLLALVLRARRGGFDHRDSIDLMIVTLAASLSAWILLASRLIDDGHPAAASIVNASFIVVAVLLFTFIVDLLFPKFLDNRAMQFLTLAGFANLAAAFLAVSSVTTNFDPTTRASAMIYAAAYLLMSAAFVHPSVSETLRSGERTDVDLAYTPLRMTLTAACLVVSGVLIVSLTPFGSADVAVRITGLVALVALVVTRLVVAVRSHERAQAILLAQLDRDELTDLPNRHRFIETLDRTLETSWRSEFRPTVIQINLNRFKNINDSLGHYEGNQVLIAVARRLEVAVGEFGGIAARSGGDGFVVLDPSTSSTVDAMDRAATVQQALAEAIKLGEMSVFVTASCGVAVAPRSRSIAAEDFLRQADIASHQAKSNGRNRAALFDDSMQSHLAHRMDVEHALHGAIGRQEMHLYYQPIVDVATGHIAGFEALLRWQRGDTVVSPAEFIPIAEETGIICELGEWAVQEAMQELRGWIDDGVVDPDSTMSVNVSPRQILDADFPHIVQRALAASGMPAEQLWLEMTESMMLDEPELARTTLHEIRSTGVRIALDDFGTGYSSLSMLQQFPIQRLKIDRAFVQGIADDGNDRSLVLTIVALAKSMGLDLVAEGVETVHQLGALDELACDKAQGYLISRPVPADAMRSTMVGLAELASLSPFTSTSERPSEPSLAPLAQPRPAATAPSEFSAMQLSRSLATTGSRPLRQPML